MHTPKTILAAVRLPRAPAQITVAALLAVAVFGSWGLQEAISGQPVSMPVQAQVAQPEWQRVDYYRGLAINTLAPSSMTRQQAGARAAAFAEATTGPLAADAVEPSKVAAAIRSLGLLPEAVGQLSEKVASGAVTMRYIELLNDSTADGDSVAVTAGGITSVVRLFAKPSAVAIPVPAGGTSVRVTGVTDTGAKGIMAAVVAGGTLVRIPVESPGQSAAFQII